MKKVLSLALSILMIITLIPVIVLANNETEASFALAGGSVEVDGTQDKTVTVVFYSVDSLQVVAINGSCDVTPHNGITLTQFDVPWTLNASNLANVETGMFSYADDSSFVGFTSAADASIVTMTYTVNKDVDTGRYPVTLTMVKYCNEEFGDKLAAQVAQKTYTAYIDVTNTSGGDAGDEGNGDSGTTTPSDTYQPSLVVSGANGETVTVGEQISLELSMNKVYAAMQMTITYDSAYVTFNEEASTLVIGGDTEDKRLFVNDNGTGTLKLAAYGADKAVDEKFILVFDTIANGNATFAITEAKVGTGTSAENANLTKVSVEELPEKEDTVVIEKASWTVTFEKYNGEDIFTGANSVKDGNSYTFNANNAYYNYSNIKVLMGDVDVTSSAVTGNAATGWTVANVTGNLTISGERSPMTYSVTKNTVFGGTTTSETDSATYGVDYTFTIPATVPAGKDPGYTYTLTSVTINGTEYNNYTPGQNNDYTISGEAVTGNIVITITKTEQPANTFTVTLTGGGAGNVTMTPENGVVTLDDNKVTFTLNPQPGYDYTIQVGTGAVEEFTGTHEITVTANVTVTVEKVLNTESAEQFEYLQLNDQKMYLITIGAEDVTNDEYTYTYTYQDKVMDMLWSDKYNAYAILIIADENFEVDRAKFALKDNAAVAVDYSSYDINDSNDTDANDAQLIWNMYNAKYADFDTIKMEQFLSADLNDERGVNAGDALVIINEVLKFTETNS